MIEGSDACDDAVGLAQCQMQILLGRRNGLAFELVDKTCVVVQAVDRHADIAPHRRNGVSGIGDLHMQDFLRALA